MMKTNLRATFIRADGGAEKQVTPCAVHHDSEGSYITVKAADTPDWMSLDADIVAATPSGDVKAAFVPDGVAIVDTDAVDWSSVPAGWTGMVAVYVDSG